MPIEPTLDLLLVDDQGSAFPRKKINGQPPPAGEDNSPDMYFGHAARWLLLAPKLAIPLLSAQSKAAGHSVESVYLPLLPWNRARFRRLLGRKPLVVGITTVAIFDVHYLAQITDEVRRISPGSIIVLGGHGAADSADIRALGDLYISNHGEWALARLITALKGGAKLYQVPGVQVSPEGRRTMEGSVRYEGIPKVEFPDWGAVSSGCIRYPVEASRGCTFNCSYCIFPGKASQVFRKVEDVVGEMRYVRETRGIRRIEFVDSSLTTDPKFILGLCAALRKEKRRPNWTCFSRPDAFARVPELAGEMAAAGCTRVFMGIESIHDHILSAMRRHMTRDTIERGLSHIFKARLGMHANFIIGFPGETEATVKETEDFIIRHPFTSVYLCTFGMSPEMRDLAAAEPGRYAHLRGEPIKGWRHDGMDYLKAYQLTLKAMRRINWRKLWPVVMSVSTNDPDMPPY